jgi:AcrR family transcriptional regulator
MTATLTSRSYGGVAADERRAARRERLLDAGLELLGTEGSGATTVRGVCVEAGLTTRYFYENFSDLDELLLAVFDRIVAEASVAVLVAVAAAPRDAHATARAAIESFVAHVTDDPRRARVAFVEAHGSERLMQRRLDAMRTFSRLIAEQAGRFYGFKADGEPLVAMTASVLVGGMAELLITWLDGSLPITRDQLVDDYAELFVATGETAVAIARRRARATRS